MSPALRLSTIVMLGAGGLFTGGVVWYAWERVWIWRRLTLAAFAIDFRRSLRKADPALPILLVISAAGAGSFASLSGGSARMLSVAGIALLAVILVSSLILAEPINSQFRRVPEGTVPQSADDLRRRWRRFHLVRTALALAAFALFVTAVSYA
jgi:Domain of unknown function (DUF1772)